MSLKDTDALCPQVGLQGIITGLSPKDFDVSRVIVMAPNYLKQLSKVLDKTSDEVLQNYFLWKAIQGLATYIEADELKPYMQFRNELQGKDPDSAPERWRTCVQHVDGTLGWILSRFFVEKAFSAKAKDLGDRIVSDIKDQFALKLKATEWMEEKVIKAAINKVHNIFQKIGYPTESPNIMDPPSLEEYYSTVDISSKKFFNNALDVSRFDVKREWSALGKPVDRGEWYVLFLHCCLGP